MPRPDDLHETKRALWRLASAVLAMALCAAVSYTLPALARVRPWVAGEGLPIARMFSRGATELPGFAEAGLLGDSATQEETGALLGTELAKNLADQRQQPARASEQSEPAGMPEPAQGHGPALRIEPSEYDGLTREIENTAALESFFARLAATARRAKGAITRVAHYGDSSVAADAITHTARRRLQRRFGDAGHGFVLISRGDMHYAHRDIVHRSSDGWEVHSLVRRTLGDAWYGYGGVQARGRAGEHARFGTPDDTPVGNRVSRFVLYYQKNRRGGKVRLRVDGEEPRIVNTRAPKKQDAWERIEVADGSHTLYLSALGGGMATLYGVALERDVPGVVYDSLGLVGARAQRLLNSEAAHFKRQIAQRDPHLLVLGFGGNEAGNAWLSLPRYEKELVQVVRHVRAGKPEMACLLFGPLDQAERNQRGNIVTLETLPQIVEVQRAVAKREGCAFFDTYAAMGGEGSISRWRRTRPRLATSDLRHATPEGYELIGNLYYKALLKAFAEHLQRKP